MGTRGPVHRKHWRHRVRAPLPQGWAMVSGLHNALRSAGTTVEYEGSGCSPFEVRKYSFGGTYRVGRGLPTEAAKKITKWGNETGLPSKLHNNQAQLTIKRPENTSCHSTCSTLAAGKASLGSPRNACGRQIWFKDCEAPRVRLSRHSHGSCVRLIAVIPL
jgi:hypothetical protein